MYHNLLLLCDRSSSNNRRTIFGLLFIIPQNTRRFNQKFQGLGGIRFRCKLPAEIDQKQHAFVFQIYRRKTILEISNIVQVFDFPIDYSKKI